MTCIKFACCNDTLQILGEEPADKHRPRRGLERHEGGHPYDPYLEHEYPVRSSNTLSVPRIAREPT